MDSIQEKYEQFLKNYASKNQVVPWFAAILKTRLTQNITLEDWNYIQITLKSAASDDISVKTFIDAFYTDYIKSLNNVDIKFEDVYNQINAVSNRITEVNNRVTDTNLRIDGVDAKFKNYIPLSQKGIVNGVATLDEYGNVPSSQLPSFVDDVIEGELKSQIEFLGTDGIIYNGDNAMGRVFLDIKTNKSYRWAGTQFAVIGSDLALGETADTAYAGNKGAKNREDINDLLAGESINRIGLLSVDVYSEFEGTIDLIWDEDYVISLIYKDSEGTLTATIDSDGGNQ